MKKERKQKADWVSRSGGRARGKEEERKSKKRDLEMGKR